MAPSSPTVVGDVAIVGQQRQHTQFGNMGTGWGGGGHKKDRATNLICGFMVNQLTSFQWILKYFSQHLQGSIPSTNRVSRSCPKVQHWGLIKCPSYSIKLYIIELPLRGWDCPAYGDPWQHRRSVTKYGDNLAAMALDPQSDLKYLVTRGMRPTTADTQMLLTSLVNHLHIIKTLSM